MRVALSMLPAVLVTLALFYLMHLIISGEGRPSSRPPYDGFVDFVRVERAPDEPARTPRRRALPERPASPGGPLAQPQVPQGEIVAPQAATLTAPALEPPPLEIGGEPYLGPVVATIPEPPAPEPAIAKPPVAKPPVAKPRVAKPAAPRPKAAPVQPAIAKPAPVPAQAVALPGKDLAPAGLPGPAQAPPAGGGGVQLGSPGLGGDGDIIPLFKLEPRYPRKAARLGQEGWVKVAFTITAEGKVADARVVDSHPRRVFDRSAVKAIRKWRFKPMVVDGKPVARQASQTIEFKLVGD